MKKWMMVLAVLVIAFSTGGVSQGATYDATGDWLIQTMPGTTLLGIEIPVAETMTTITQYGDDTFSFITDPIVELAGISYSGSGTITDLIYSFAPPLSESGNPSDFDATAPDIDLTATLEGFTLTSPFELFGHLSVSSVILGQPVNLGDVGFTGTNTAVPLPGAFWLLGSGLACLLGIGEKARQRS